MLTAGAEESSPCSFLAYGQVELCPVQATRCSLTPKLLLLLQLVKEAQALHVRSEMAALATEAKGLMDAESWLPPEPPHSLGGTRLPHMFGALAQQRMVDLVSFRWQWRRS